MIKEGTLLNGKSRFLTDKERDNLAKKFMDRMNKWCQKILKGGK